MPIGLSFYLSETYVSGIGKEYLAGHSIMPKVIWHGKVRFGELEARNSLIGISGVVH